MLRLASRTPLIVATIAALAAIAGALTLWLAAETPWLGFPLVPHGAAVMVERDAPGITAGTVLRAIGVPSLAPLALQAGDLVAEPDGLPTYAAIDEFYRRQDQLFALLGEPKLELHLIEEGQSRTELVVPQQRPLWSLAPSFWIQLTTGIVSALIAGWVWALRPNHLAPTLFAASGLGVILVTSTSAAYAHRGLALPAEAYAVLMPINHFGILLFAAALLGLFLIYPKRLVRQRLLWLIPALMLPFWLMDTAHTGFEADFYYAVVVAAVIAILGLIAAQWWATRRDPDQRAALGWLGLSVAFALSVFAFLSVAPTLLGLESPLSQHYAAGAIVLIYCGLALGLRRYRLFELGEWSYRILYYTLGAFLLLALDAALIAGLNLGLAPALAVSLLLVGLLYLPLRDWLWNRLFARNQLPQHELFSAAMDVAFAPSRFDSAQRWRQLLNRLFDPLETIDLAEPVTLPAVSQDGLTLDLPPVAGAPALSLHHPFGGNGLFQSPHLSLATNLVALTERAEESRQAYMRGVGEERRRMARDLHDDVGARLLTGLHTADERTRPTLQAALSDIRAIVSGLAGEEAALDLVLAQIRHEAARRLEAAGIELDWPLADTLPAVNLDYRVHKAMTSAVREVVSNTIRHSGARTLHVGEQLTPGDLTLHFADDGSGMPDGALSGETQGFGLKNLRQRFADIGGSVRFATGTGTSIALTLPLSLAPRPLEPGVRPGETALDFPT